MIPKKIKIALDKLKIDTVVNGYFARTGDYYTCWDKSGQVVCVLEYCKKFKKWELKTKE